MEHFQQEELFIFLSRITCSKVDTKDTDKVSDSYIIVCLCMCLDARARVSNTCTHAHACACVWGGRGGSNDCEHSSGVSWLFNSCSIFPILDYLQVAPEKVNIKHKTKSQGVGVGTMEFKSEYSHKGPNLELMPNSTCLSNIGKAWDKIQYAHHFYGKQLI